jgi:hypothetical protein
MDRELARARIGDAKARGAKIGRRPKLTAQQKHEAVKRRDTGNEACGQIAASYNLSASTISRLP